MEKNKSIDGLSFKRDKEAAAPKIGIDGIAQKKKVVKPAKVVVKEVKVSKIESTKVIPLGNTIGIKLFSDGVLVIGMTEVEGKKPYENTGIKIENSQQKKETNNNTKNRNVTLSFCFNYSTKNFLFCIHNYLSFGPYFVSTLFKMIETGATTAVKRRPAAETSLTADFLSPTIVLNKWKA